MIHKKKLAGLQVMISDADRVRPKVRVARWSSCGHVVGLEIWAFRRWFLVDWLERDALAKERMDARLAERLAAYERENA